MVQQRDLVFISYSHTDRDWLARLLVFLKPFTGPNFRVWADPYIKIGEEWRRNVSEAMSRTCVAVLLVSPDFLASDFIRDEELPLLLEGAKAGTITLFPIAISASSYRATALTHYQFAHPPERPLDRMPRSRRHAGLVQITEKIVEAAQTAPPDMPAAPAPVAERSATVIASPGQVAILHGVPGQRPNYLRRQEYLDRLKQALLGADERVVGITGATRQGTPIGLHGMGGIGKTVLAIDLVNDDEVRRAFPDGIFWLTLGQTIEPPRLQGELATYMTGEARAFATVGEARDQLRQLVDSRSCLLVLDDLWRPQDAEPFDVLGPRSRLLVTTRDADLLVALGARELSLDVLSEELALELLSSWSGQPRAELPQAARNVAESCGYLPLALALAGAHVQGGARWAEVQSALQRGRLEFLDHPYGSVFGSLRLSTDALRQPERARYFELAVFPEDAVIPVAAICTLWRHTGGMDPDASRDLLRRLHRRALLTLSAGDTGISFHDLQHDFLRLNIASLVGGHAALVEAYRATAPSGWTSGSDDGYFFQHLPQHLAAADRLDELKGLLCSYDWLVAKLRTTNITAVLPDFDLVENEPSLTLVQQALRLSIPAVSGDPLQLPSQLHGRLKGMGGRSVETLLQEAERGPARVWLSSRFQSLTPAGGPLRQILVGHGAPVNAVAFLAAGARALSASFDRKLRLWDVSTGETLRILEGHTGSVNSVAILPDGNRAVSGSHDRTLRLWDLTTGDSLRLLRGHFGSVRAVAVLADARLALSGASDNTLRLWDLTTGETLRTLDGHTRGVIAMTVLADSRHALSGSYDNTLRLWDLSSGECVRTLDGHYSFVTSLAGLADGRHALSSSSDDTLRLWDLATGETLKTLSGHAGPLRAVVVLADGDHALSGAYDGELRLWDLVTGETLSTFAAHTQPVMATAVSRDGGRAISAAADNTLRLWGLPAGDCLAVYTADAPINCAAFARDDLIVAGSADGRIHIVEIRES